MVTHTKKPLNTRPSRFSSRLDTTKAPTPNQTTAASSAQRLTSDKLSTMVSTDDGAPNVATAVEHRFTHSFVYVSPNTPPQRTSSAVHGMLDEMATTTTPEADVTTEASSMQRRTVRVDESVASKVDRIGGDDNGTTAMVVTEMMVHTDIIIYATTEKATMLNASSSQMANVTMAAMVDDADGIEPKPITMLDAISVMPSVAAVTAQTPPDTIDTALMAVTSPGLVGNAIAGSSVSMTSQPVVMVDVMESKIVTEMENAIDGDESKRPSLMVAPTTMGDSSVGSVGDPVSNELDVKVGTESFRRPVMLDDDKPTTSNAMLETTLMPHIQENTDAIASVMPNMVVEKVDSTTVNTEMTSEESMSVEFTTIIHEMETGSKQPVTESHLNDVTAVMTAPNHDVMTLSGDQSTVKPKVESSIQSDSVASVQMESNGPMPVPTTTIVHYMEDAISQSATKSQPNDVPANMTALVLPDHDVMPLSGDQTTDASTTMNPMSESSVSMIPAQTDSIVTVQMTSVESVSVATATTMMSEMDSGTLQPIEMSASTITTLPALNPDLNNQITGIMSTQPPLESETTMQTHNSTSSEVHETITTAVANDESILSVSSDDSANQITTEKPDQMFTLPLENVSDMQMTPMINTMENDEVPPSEVMSTKDLALTTTQTSMEPAATTPTANAQRDEISPPTLHPSAMHEPSSPQTTQEVSIDAVAMISGAEPILQHINTTTDEHPSVAAMTMPSIMNAGPSNVQRPAEIEAEDDSIVPAVAFPAIGGSATLQHSTTTTTMASTTSARPLRKGERAPGGTATRGSMSMLGIGFSVAVAWIMTS